jgi:dihydrodipicolinate synthase/N-acetylneuraminate lyase
MAATFDVHGLICPMVTPLNHEQDLDLEATRRLVQFLIEHRIDAVFVGGTTGEGPLLSLDERRRLAECVVDVAQARITVIIHTGCQNTRDSQELTRHAASIGAHATAAITPYFFAYSDDEIGGHYLALAEAAPDLALLLYAFPGNAKNDVSPELLFSLRERASNIVGIKYSGNSLERVQEYIQAAGDTGYVYTGNDSLLLSGLLLGTSGAVSGLSAPFPESLRRLYDAFAASRWSEARQAQTLVRHLARTLAYGRPAHLKAALELRGLRAGPVRAPMMDLSPAEHAALREQLAALLQLL